MEEIGAPLFKDGGGGWWWWDMVVAVFVVRGAGGGWGGGTGGGGGGVNHWEGQDWEEKEKDGTGKLGQHYALDETTSLFLFIHQVSQ